MQIASTRPISAGSVAQAASTDWSATHVREDLSDSLWVKLKRSGNAQRLLALSAFCHTEDAGHSRGRGSSAASVREHLSDTLCQATHRNVRLDMQPIERPDLRLHARRTDGSRSICVFTSAININCPQACRFESGQARFGDVDCLLALLWSETGDSSLILA